MLEPAAILLPWSVAAGRRASWVLLLLLAKRASGQCTPLELPRPGWTHAECDNGGCCDRVPAEGFHGKWISLMVNRSGVPTAVLSQIAKAKPAGHLLEVDNVADRPRSADSLMGGRQYLGMSLQIFRINSVDQKKQSFNMHYTMSWYWRDCRLLFNCSEFLTVHQDHPEYPDFWKPKANIVEKEYDEVSVYTGRHSLMGEGADLFVENHYSTFRCGFDFTDMPFDEQTCKLRFILPGLTKEEYDVKWMQITSDKLLNAEWDFQDVAEWRREESSLGVRVSSGVPEQHTPMLSVEFTMKRRPSYLVNQFVAMCSLFYILSWLSLWIDATVIPARIAACTVPALTASNKMNALASLLPAISYQTRLQTFMEMVLSVIIVHAFEFVAVHFSLRRLKAFAEQEKKRADADAEGQPLPPAPGIEKKIASFVSKYADPIFRIASPICFVVASAVILAT